MAKRPERPEHRESEAEPVSLGSADLIALIAASIRRHATHIGEKEAHAIADTILRDLRAAGSSHGCIADPSKA